MGYQWLFFKWLLHRITGGAGVGIALPQDALAAAANPAGFAFVGNRFDGDVSLFVPTRSRRIHLVALSLKLNFLPVICIYLTSLTSQ
jgi:hypothetical protein